VPEVFKQETTIMTENTIRGTDAQGRIWPTPAMLAALDRLRVTDWNQWAANLELRHEGEGFERTVERVREADALKAKAVEDLCELIRDAVAVAGGALRALTAPASKD
jgi:hypothetical protein